MVVVAAVAVRVCLWSVLDFARPPCLVLFAHWSAATLEQLYTSVIHQFDACSVICVHHTAASA